MFSEVGSRASARTSKKQQKEEETKYVREVQKISTENKNYKETVNTN